MSFRGHIMAAARMRCPRCGKGRLFLGPFKMHQKCGTCQLDLLREPGFWLGSIYFNYGVTALILVAGYCWGLFGLRMNNDLLLILGGVFAVLFPLLFFRHARSLWLALDQWADPVLAPACDTNWDDRNGSSPIDTAALENIPLAERHTLESAEPAEPANPE